MQETLQPLDDFVPTFELVVYKAGKPRSITTDSPDKLASFYHRMADKPKRKRKKSNKSELPKSSDIDKIMDAVNKFADEVKTKKTKMPPEE